METVESEQGHAQPIVDVEETACCVVGAGPAGMVLALLLARRDVPVVLLEAHRDFDREFRGDTLHPAILEIMAEIGLADTLHRLPHVKLRGPVFLTAEGPFMLFDFRRLRTRYPYIMLIPQERFLETLAAEFRKYPSVQLRMGANVQRLVEEDGVVRGVRYRTEKGWHEVRARLTVGADGRFSRLRKLGGFDQILISPPMELLWFRLPRLPGDMKELSAYAGSALEANSPTALILGEDPEPVAGFLQRVRGRLVLALNRLDHWQIGYFFPPGHYQEFRAMGVDAMRRSIADAAPFLARHVEHLTEWSQLSFLSVAFSRCVRWHKPGLLLIGDAAHVMTPAAGAGIKYAIEDAVVAANILARPLKVGRVTLRDLARVQRRRQWPTRFIQAGGAFAQRYILPRVLRSDERIHIPRLVRLLYRIPIVRDLPARMLGFGIWRVHVEN